MSHEELRHALGRLAAEAPIEMRRSEQVWARHRRNRRRQIAVIGSSVAAALALLLAVPSASDRQGLVTDDRKVPTTSPIPEPSASATPSPAPVGGGNPGEPTSSPGSVAPVVSETPVKALPRWPVGVVAYIPGHVNPGKWVSLNVFPHAGDNGVESFEVDWGDGTKPTVTRVDHCGFKLGDRRYYSGQTNASHQFAGVGNFVVRVTVRFAGCGRPTQTATTTTSVLVDDVPVVDGPSASVSLDFRRAEPKSAEPLTAAVSLGATDADGYIAFAIVEWGDGSLTVLRNGVPAWCKESPPALDPDFPAHVEHTYARAGKYSVHAQVYAAPCGGGPSDGAGQRLPLTVS